MWANAQRDGRPAAYTWRPVFNCANIGWRPLLECRAVTLPRGEIRWNLLGCPKLANRSQPLVGRSSPYCDDVWGRYCCLTTFTKHELTFSFAICCRPSVCRLSSVYNARAPYSGGCNFPQYFYGIRYLGHPMTSIENFTEFVPGEPLRLLNFESQTGKNCVC